MRTKLIALFICFPILLCFALPMNTNASEEVIKLVMSSPWPPAPNTLGAPVEWFMDQLEKRSNGKVKFEKHWAGSLTSGPASLEHLKDGVVDLGGMAWLYNPGLTPIGMIDFAVPFGTTDPWIQNQVKRDFYKNTQQARQELDRFNIIPVVWISSPKRDLITQFPVNSLKDLDGKKLGAPGSFLPKYVKAAGASGVHAPMTEAYMMHQKGVIVGQLLTIDLINDFKLYEVCKYYTDVGLASVTHVIFGFNKDSFNKLPKGIQNLAMEISEECSSWYVGWLNKRVTEMRQHMKDNGVTFSKLPDGEMAKWVQGMLYIPGSWAKEMESKGLPGWQMMETYIEIMQGKGHKFPDNWTLKKGS
jgi:TRAP-type C4-dicarboxylate transport system substrate-binding protein